MKAGVVILNYNTPEMTINLTRICWDCRDIQHVVVVDNASTDGSAQTLQRELEFSESSKAELILSRSNGGYAAGNNIGLRRLVRDYGCDVAFISNPDVAFTEGLIEHILEAFASHPDYDVLSAARTTSFPEKPICQYWQLPNYNRLLFENFYLGQKYYNKREVYSCDPTKGLYEVDVVPGSFFAIRSRALERIGYLDEGTFLYFEENCLSKKIRESGGKVGILSNDQYTVITDRPNSTSVIQKTTFSRKCYVHSKEYFARKYIGSNALQMGLLHIADEWFVFEKFLYVKFQRMAEVVNSHSSHGFSQRKSGTGV